METFFLGEFEIEFDKQVTMEMTIKMEEAKLGKKLEENQVLYSTEKTKVIHNSQRSPNIDKNVVIW